MGVAKTYSSLRINSTIGRCLRNTAAAARIVDGVVALSNGHVPEFRDGYLLLPDRPGWGTEPNEEGVRAHPPKGHAGLLNAGRKT